MSRDCESCQEAVAHDIHIECEERPVCGLCGEDWMCESYLDSIARDVAFDEAFELRMDAALELEDDDAFSRPWGDPAP